MQKRKNKGMSYRQLNLRITLLGALFGHAVPQNKEFSEHSNEPIPEDIRGNKKEGDEYATIGDVLKQGGAAKVMLIAAALLLLAVALVYGIFMWGSIFGFIS